MTMTVQLKRKKKVISKQLQDALDSIPSPDFEKLQQRVDRVFTIGRQEELSDKEIGKFVREKMRLHYSSFTIRHVFSEYPDAQFAKRGKPFSAKTSQNDDNDDEKETDKYQHYKQVIESKNKLLKQKDEEIKGLKEQLAQANKRIKELESKQNKTKPKREGTQAEKNDLFRAGLGYISKKGGEPK